MLEEPQTDLQRACAVSSALTTTISANCSDTHDDEPTTSDDHLRQDLALEVDDGEPGHADDLGQGAGGELGFKNRRDEHDARTKRTWMRACRSRKK